MYIRNTLIRLFFEVIIVSFHLYLFRCIVLLLLECLLVYSYSGLCLKANIRCKYYSCYFFFFWVQGWSFSDVMFVTKRNMANAVSNVSKQLEQVSTALAVWLKATSTSSFLNCSKRLTINRLICSSHNEICLVATFHWIFWFFAYFVVNKKTFVPRA